MTSTATTVRGGPDLPQVRRLVTPLPGPRSQALVKRRAEAVPHGEHGHAGPRVPRRVVVVFSSTSTETP